MYIEKEFKEVDSICIWEDLNEADYMHREKEELGEVVYISIEKDHNEGSTLYAPRIDYICI